MDRDRFKRKEVAIPQKRSINGDEKPFTVKPTALPKSHTVITPTNQTSQAVNNLNGTTNSDVPSLFDGEDDDDLFGVWATQKKLKQERKEREQKEKMAKMAKKMAKKEQKKLGKVSKKQNDTHGVSINISVPKIKVSKESTKKFKTLIKPPKSNKKVYYGVASLIIVPLVVIGVAIAYNQFGNNSETGKKATTTVVQGSKTLPKETPSFSILYPGGEKDKFTDKVVKVSPEGREPVFAYIDQIGGVQINLSQQELPANFKSDLDASLLRMANDFQASNIISIDGQKAYQGWSVKDNVQSVIYSKDNLLILARASQKLDDILWVEYLTSLK